MKTALIITNEEARVIAESLKKVIELVDIATTICDHGNSLNEFMETEPDICVILNYSDKSETGYPGKKTYTIIKSATDPRQIIIRIGDDPAPFQLEKFYQLLSHKQE